MDGNHETYTEYMTMQRLCTCFVFVCLLFFFGGEGVSLVIAELLLVDCLNFNGCSVLSNK